MDDLQGKREQFDSAMKTLNRVARLATLGSGPAYFALETLVEDEEERKLYQDALVSVIAALNAPGAAYGTRQALRSKNPRRSEVLREAAPSMAGVALPLIELLAREVL